jgi:glycosyltransferase involved in cell wall biosynthesis
VLPHPGGGGETYVDLLERMGGYRFERFYLAPSPRPADALRSLPRTLPALAVAVRKYDLVHVQGEVASGLTIPILALRPSVLTFNGLNLLRRLVGRRRRVAEANLRAVVRAASRTICVSESERDELRSVVGASVMKRALLVRNSVPPVVPTTLAERQDARTSFAVPEGAVVGVWVAGLDEVKDPLVAVRAAIEAARDVPLLLLMAGDGALQNEIRGIAGASQVVRILGHRRDVRAVLAAADFFVLSSQREGLSFALLEAMQIGLPVVVSDAPGNIDAVGAAGIVARRGDAAGFASAFRELAMSGQKRAALGEQARERAARRFRLDEMTALTRAAYDSVIDGG